MACCCDLLPTRSSPIALLCTVATPDKRRSPVVVAAASERQKYERDLSGGTSHEGVAESAAQLAKAANASLLAAANAASQPNPPRVLPTATATASTAAATAVDLADNANSLPTAASAADPTAAPTVANPANPLRLERQATPQLRPAKSPSAAPSPSDSLLNAHEAAAGAPPSPAARSLLPEPMLSTPPSAAAKVAASGPWAAGGVSPPPCVGRQHTRSSLEVSPEDLAEHTRIPTDRGHAKKPALAPRDWASSR